MAASLLLEGLPRREFPPGVALLEQGAVPEAAHYLSVGVVKLNHISPDGRTSIVGIRYPGAWIGSAAAMIRSPLLASAVTVTRCQVILVRSRLFRALVGTRRSWSSAMLRAQSLEVQSLFEQVAAFGSLSARHRLEEVLRGLWRELRTASAGDEDVVLPLRDYEIAQLLGVTPQYVSRLLHELEAAGRIVHQGHRWILTGNVRTTAL